MLKPGFEGRVTEQQIIDWSHDNMAAYKVPRIVQFVDSLPKSGAGKVMWRHAAGGGEVTPRRQELTGRGAGTQGSF